MQGKETRGRPKEIPFVLPPTKFVREYKNQDGTTEKWSYDLKKCPEGPLSVEIFYPKDWISEDDERELKEKGIPKTKRKYYNPANDKMVSYQRALQLGLLEDEKPKEKKIKNKSITGKRGRPKVEKTIIIKKSKTGKRGRPKK